MNHGDSTLSRTKQLLRGALTRDTWHTLSPCDVLLVRHDNNCGYTFQGKAYAHLIDSFGELCTKRRLKVQTVAKLYSVLVGTRAYHSPVSYTQADIVIGLFRRVIQVISGADIAAQWAKSRPSASWCAILGRAKLKIVVRIQPDEYLCRAGKKMGIPV